MATFMILMPLPEGSKAVKSAALEAASSSIRGTGWAPSGPASSWEWRGAQGRQARFEGAGAALERCQGGQLDHAALPRRPLSGTMAMGGAVAPSACEASG